MRSPWFFHPIVIFVFSVIALGLSLFLYIYWYVSVSSGLNRLIQRFDLDRGQFMESQTWVVIVVLSILVGIILMGIFIIFAYNQKNFQLYRLQHNFINSFTHELKTPVTSIKLYLETFLKYTLNREEQLKYIQYMLNDVNRLSGNITSILNLARLESKSYRGELESINIVGFIEQFCQSNKYLFEKLEITIEKPALEPIFCNINPPLFEMLLMNLFTNAVKYNQAPDKRLGIHIDAEKKLHISFKDNGVGIKQSEIKKIFKKFYQVGRADDMTAKGSGLGLYLVQQISRIHKGKIFAKANHQGRGSTFVLIIPYWSVINHKEESNT